jgi:uncharacterized protein
LRRRKSTALEPAVSKLILLLLFGVCAFLLFKSLKRRDRSRDAGASGPRTPERMVACAACGVYLPEGEAIESSGRHFCCEEHRRMGE